MSSSPLGSSTVTQVGIIVENIEEAAQAWATVLGVVPPKIEITDTLEKSQARYQGQPTTARAKLAFIPLGQVSLELIEPIGEPSTWGDHLNARGTSLHHIAFEIKGMGDRVAALADHGLPLVQKGEYTGGRYAYFDGQEKLGAVVELLEND
jgi:hypothetical protein